MSWCAFSKKKKKKIVGGGTPITDWRVNYAQVKKSEFQIV